MIAVGWALALLAGLSATVLAAGPGGAAGARPGAEKIAAVRRAAWKKQQRPVCITGVVTVETGVLTSGPQDFYLQDESGGIFVRGHGGQAVERSAKVRACGVLSLYENSEPTVEQAEVTLEGKQRPLAARRLRFLRGERAATGLQQ